MKGRKRYPQRQTFVNSTAHHEKGGELDRRKEQVNGFASIPKPMPSETELTEQDDRL